MTAGAPKNPNLVRSRLAGNLGGAFWSILRDAASRLLRMRAE